uniref:Uncharacterized protein n=1 Tax=Arundo donax TaxID=35708 RepID=A0A0A9GD48_ARUDO
MMRRSSFCVLMMMMLSCLQKVIMLLVTIPLHFFMSLIFATTVMVLTTLTGSSFSSLRMHIKRNLSDALNSWSMDDGLQSFLCCSIYYLPVTISRTIYV